jgi:hypothetical protein
VGKTNYRNRLWAFVEHSMDSIGQFNEQKFLDIGRETDRLYELFNSGLHHFPAKGEVARALFDLIAWSSSLIEIDPGSVPRPYRAYEEEMRKFFLEVAAMTPD